MELELAPAWELEFVPESLLESAPALGSVLEMAP